MEISGSFSSGNYGTATCCGCDLSSERPFPFPLGTLLIGHNNSIKPRTNNTTGDLTKMISINLTEIYLNICSFFKFHAILCSHVNRSIPIMQIYNTHYMKTISTFYSKIKLDVLREKNYSQIRSHWKIIPNKEIVNRISGKQHQTYRSRHANAKINSYAEMIRFCTIDLHMIIVNRLPTETTTWRKKYFYLLVWAFWADGSNRVGGVLGEAVTATGDPASLACDGVDVLVATPTKISSCTCKPLF